GPDDPARRRGELNRVMRAALAQEERRPGAGELDNGLDLALVRVVPGEGRLRFAGARLPLWVARPGEALLELPGDRHSLGYRRSDPEFRFTNRDLALGADFGYYLTTDGVLDQGGGDRGFGFGRRRLRGVLERVRDLPMADQGAALTAELAAYQGAAAQRDDLTAWGFRLPPEPHRE
ncbi:MAG: SpoIIE family protein phosphatase, partial [Deferrisomatales bacterium]